MTKETNLQDDSLSNGHRTESLANGNGSLGRNYCGNNLESSVVEDTSRSKYHKTNNNNHTDVESVNEENNDQNKSISCSERICSWRSVMVILLHTSFMTAVFARNCMPIALVCMTQTKTDLDDDESNINDSSVMNGTLDAQVASEEIQQYEFAWNSELQGLILSAVSFLSFLAPLITNFIQPYFGHKNSLTFMALLVVIITLVSPVASRSSPYLLVAARIVLGGTFGANVPVIGDSVARWAPTTEKQTMITIIFTGLQTGGIFSSILSGYLCTIPIDNGWPFIFYVIGAICFLWVFLWHFLSSVTPENHPYISEKELQYILQHRTLKETQHNGKTESPPYKIILTSVPVLANLISSSLHFWTVILFFTYFAIYLAGVLDFSVTETGVIMTALSLSRLLGMAAITGILNCILGLNKWSKTAVKKCVLFAGALTTSVCHVPVILIDSDQRWVVTGCFLVAMFFQSSAGCILPAIPLDIAPKYAGFITGLQFSIGGLLAISAPLVVAGLTPNNTEDEWQKVWILLACLFICIALVFGLFGDCTLQPWAQEEDEENRQEPPAQVVSPFDPMQKRFSAALIAPPSVLAVDVRNKDIDIPAKNNNSRKNNYVNNHFQFDFEDEKAMKLSKLSSNENEMKDFSTVSIPKIKISDTFGEENSEQSPSFQQNMSGILNDSNGDDNSNNSFKGKVEEELSNASNDVMSPDGEVNKGFESGLDGSTPYSSNKREQGIDNAETIVVRF